MVATDHDPIIETLAALGDCLELISIDQYGRGRSVGFYEKDEVITVWSFSREPDAAARLTQIRDRAVALGNLAPVEGEPHQFRFPGGRIYRRPLRFLARQAVEKDPNLDLPAGRIEVKDLKSPLILFATPSQVEDGEGDGRWIYRVDGEGEAKRPEIRLRATVKGLQRYGEMEQVDETAVSFPCGTRYDGLMRLLMPYARNVSGTEDMLEALDTRGQMTTGTMGFSQR